MPNRVTNQKHRFYVCPSCERRGVYFKILPSGANSYRCKYCAWGALSGKERDESDNIKLTHLGQANGASAKWFII